MEDRIEERVIIRAAQDQVWHLVVRPGWWLPGSSAPPARGPGRVAVTYRGDERPYVIDIVRIEPRGYASFRWASAFGGAAPAPGKATLVECYLRPVGTEVGVTVVESGFASLDLPEALRESEWTGSKGGWQYELAELRTRAEVGRLSPGRAIPRTLRLPKLRGDHGSGHGGRLRSFGTGVRCAYRRAASAAAQRSSTGGAAHPGHGAKKSARTRENIPYCGGMSVVWNRHRCGTLDS